jgi:hypothetical protein
MVANVVLENNNGVIFATGPTTLAAGALAGDSNIKVASTSGFKVGMAITVDADPNAEPATISGVGTSGAGGTGLTLTGTLLQGHASGVTVYGPAAPDPAGDMTRVFGALSPEWNEGVASQKANPGTAKRNLAQTDFVGLAIHCAKTADSICAGNPNARDDKLPDEVGTYTGFKGLFGAKYVIPAINGGSAVLKKLNGDPITDQFGQPGFPGFDGLFATTTLALVAQMQEAGVAVTFGYISDAHDQHGLSGEIHATRGPGEADYVQQLKDYDTAFGQFFARLAAHGINKSNTLFVFTVEEGDHFVGSAPSPANCDGVHTPCSYSLVGEINGNLTGLLAAPPFNIVTPFTVHADMAPTIYLNGNPGRSDVVTRDFGRALGNLQATSLYTGNTDVLAAALADSVGMNALHMVTADPQRTPTLVMFAHPDYFFFTATSCGMSCLTVPTTPNNNFAWNHGGIQPEIATTWLGIVGPGVRHLGNDTTWADHTDTRPTMLSLVGLQDTYPHDGRVLVDQLDASAVPQSLRAHRETLQRLGEVYKQLNAPFGQFGTDALTISTRAIKSNTAGDATYTALEQQIEDFTTQRDDLAGQMRSLLDGAAFKGQAIDEGLAKSLIQQGQLLLNQVHAAAQP